MSGANVKIAGNIEGRKVIYYDQRSLTVVKNFSFPE